MKKRLANPAETAAQAALFANLITLSASAPLPTVTVTLHRVTLKKFTPPFFHKPKKSEIV